MTLTFKNVISKTFDLEYEIPREVGEHYESLVSFNRGYDFNKEIREFVISFVEQFSEFLTPENEQQLNERLVNYNKLVVELKTNILQATTIPSVMICGPANYPTRRKQKEEERIYQLESELYSKNGKHARYIENTRKMFDPVLIDQKIEIDKKRKEKAEEKGWKNFYKEVNHEELAGYGFDVENNRFYLVTHGKPSDDVRALLKKAALRWSPRNKRWQRILTVNAINSVNRNVMNGLGLPQMEEK
ncbi:hypothetical protein EGW69_12525 [Enterococcus faecium]|uniref:hypothetical protein n=1 Tax=Enterococcus faecium TaxID=1352 RepID=UPI000CF05F5E|nr:hypothetical protein [Enterococcus faecium]EGP5273312.1 hypothetical protein [Enterococcus faecium]MBD9765825.1 hypothetical protein [Enterococcus faecium]MDQ8291674.1 hypothetical protein [Enterococcus faecium]MDQ8448063.1 hypothetical protein [Enterococcus faecium]PQB46472.1 hypothetical protein CUN27_09675 [Enterococcus faecium]